MQSEFVRCNLDTLVFNDFLKSKICFKKCSPSEDTTSIPRSKPDRQNYLQKSVTIRAGFHSNQATASHDGDSGVILAVFMLKKRVKRK